TTLVIATFTVEVFVIRTEKVTGPPGSFTEVGLADFCTSIDPRPTVCFAFAKTHLTVSPASSWNVAVRVPRFPLDPSSSHSIDVRNQPSAPASVDVYVPGS